MKSGTLGQVCEINPKCDNGLNPQEQCSFVPMEFVDDASARIMRADARRVAEVQKGYTPFRNGDVILAKITPCLENGKCAIAKNLINGIAFGSTEFHVLRAGESVLPEWLYYFVRQARVRDHLALRMHGSAGQQRVPSAALEELVIPLPQLPEQQRIAAILDRADRLRRTRRSAQQMSETLLQAVFVRMFGDPGCNSKGWRVSQIDEVLDQNRVGIRTGPFGSSLKRSECVERGIPVWGIDNVRENEFVETGSLFITESKFRDLSIYSVEYGDVLVSRAGTVGRMCVARPIQSPSIIGSNLLRVALDKTMMLPDYLTTLFTYFVHKFAHLKMSSDENAYSFINPVIMHSLSIPVPPLALQQQFARVVQQFERLRAQQREAERQAEQLFQALLQRAFSGGL